MVADRRMSGAVASCLLAVLVGACESASDWPMWRRDAGRTAGSPERLPGELHLRWERRYAKRTQVWQDSINKDLMPYDRVFEPVVMGKTLFLGFNDSDKLVAFDTETGAEIWAFYADGPVRLPPAAWKGRVFFTSDDGYLYCLNARDGGLVWKFRGGPSDRKALGNDRLISAWPARGGPVVVDGTVYFAASIWPFMGTFLYAIDAETGKVVWSKTGTGSRYMLQPHSSPAFAGVAPQGALVAAGDKLLVPGGRSVPACFDRKTGEFLYYRLAAGGKTGGSFVCALGNAFFCHHRGKRTTMYDLAEGKALIGGIGRYPVLTNEACYMSGGTVVALDRTREIKYRDQKGRLRVMLPELWRADVNASGDLIKAGDRLYAAGGGVLTALQLRGGKSPQVAWKKTVEGKLERLLAADGKLFAVTLEGGLYCFGRRAGAPRKYVHSPRALPRRTDTWSSTASSILKSTGASKGYCLVLGLKTGRLVEELVRRSELCVIAVDPDAAKVDRLRRRLDEAGLYGTRAAVHVGDPLTFKFPPYLAGLIVSEDLRTAGIDGGEAFAEAVFRPLRPYGGVACFSVPSAQQRRFVSSVRQAKLAGAKVERKRDFTLLIRNGPLPGSGSWTHQYADSANTVVSRDKLVKAPLGLLWFGGPSHDEVLPRHGHGPSPQVVGGRLFIEGLDMLRAVDVYTGRLLWEKDLPGIGFYYRHTRHDPGANEIGSNYVSVRDGVYLTSPRSCLRLDPATGETVKEFTLPGKKPPRWGFVTVWEDLLVSAASPIGVSLWEGKAGGWPADEMEPVIGRNSEWQYLAGSHPRGAWTEPDFKAEGWKTGRAGFGYGDDDDRTVLKDMLGRYAAVYVRRQFRVADAAGVRRLALMIRYDDAFIAYLNGKEVLRCGVRSGSGARASEIAEHEARGFEYFAIKSPGDHLRRGLNVLAIEGHNAGVDSGDFTLDPYLAVLRGRAADEKKRVEPAGLELKDVPGVTVNAEYASASGTLTVMDRHGGRVLWSRRARHGFRHNAIAVAAGKVFCIDGMNRQKLDVLRRRGFETRQRPVLYALDARTGHVVWKAEENVFGTWLGYSEEHDVLLQAGSLGRDRAWDEVEKGMVAYRGRDGRVLWQNLALEYDGPCMLRHGTIIAQRKAYDLLTGKRRTRRHPLTGEEIEWGFRRNYGCNTVVASEHLLTFRSAAAGFYDLANDGGTGNFGGFKSGCTSNLIVADGVLNAPDYTRTCTCSYQNQTSVALVHMPEAEMWTFNDLKWTGSPVRRVGINLGAPGDRLAENGTLWLDCPSVGGRSPEVPVEIRPEKLTWFRRHSSFLKGKELRWVAASGARGISSLRIGLGEGPDRTYDVRLVFAEPDGLTPGERVFSVAVQGRPALRGFDVARSGGPGSAVIRELKRVSVREYLEITLKPSRPGGRPPVLSGVEATAAGW